MSINEHSFCRESLKRVMVDVRKKFSAAEIKRAWAWCTSIGRKCYEFHGPNKEYLYNLRGADCKWSAAAAGWTQLLERKDEKKNA